MGFWRIYRIIPIPLLIVVLSFFLFLFKSNKIKNKIGNLESKENFKLIQIYNLMPFISILMNIFFIISFFNRIIGCIVIVILYYNNFKKLKMTNGAENLSESIKKPAMIVLFGMIISGIFYGNVIGTIIISFGMIFIHREIFQFVNQGDFLKLSNSLAHPKPIQQSPETIFEKTEITVKEDISQPILETTVVNTEIRPKFVKQPEITIKEEISQPNPETMTLKTEVKSEMGKTEIIINEEIPEQKFEDIVEKIEIKPEIVKQPELKSDVEINQKNISEKPIQSRIIKNEVKLKVHKKKCSFCGKEHEDLNVTFCHACGFNF